MQFFLLLLIPFVTSSPFLEALLFTQIVRSVEFDFHYNIQQIAWETHSRAIGDLGQTKGEQFFLSVLDKTAQQFELSMSRANSLEHFFKWIKEDTVGSIVGPGPLPELKKFVMTLEVSEALGPQLRNFLEQEMSKKVFKNSIVLSVLEQVTPGLRKLHLCNAYAHYRNFELYLTVIKKHPHFRHILAGTPDSAGVFPKPVNHFRFRIILLRANMMRIFGHYDYAMSPILLAASWSLAQYLKYMTQLLPEFKVEVYDLLTEYHEHVSKICRRLSQRIDIPIKVSLSLSEESIKMHGANFTQLLISPVPVKRPFKTSYHSVPVSIDDGGISIKEYVEGDEEIPTLSLIVYVTEDIVNDKTLLEVYLKKICGDLGAIQIEVEST